MSPQMQQMHEKAKQLFGGSGYVEEIKCKKLNGTGGCNYPDLHGSYCTGDRYVRIVGASNLPMGEGLTWEEAFYEAGV